jgi:HEAT repeat protein
MALTLEQIKHQLSSIEPDESTYYGIGPSEIPFLEQLIQDKKTWLAARALYALSRIPDSRVVTILSQAATDPRKEIRISLATSARNLKPQDANSILLKLLTDKELGVRKFAIKSVSEANDAAIQARLREIKVKDPVPEIRDIAKDKLQKLKLD